MKAARKAAARLELRIAAWQAIPGSASLHRGKTKITAAGAYRRPGSQKK